MQTMKSNILQQVPDNPESTKSYLFYLHGLIVEEAGIRPKSPEHGYYEYELILDALAREGFIVISEAREKGTGIIDYAEKIASQVRKFLASGISPEAITIVGASKGGIISAYASTMLQEKKIHYVFLASLFEKCLKDENLKLYGKVLSIHDRSDSQSITPALYFQRSEGLGQFAEIVTTLDIGHALIYRPYREWLEPLVEWVKTG